MAPHVLVFPVVVILYAITNSGNLQFNEKLIHASILMLIINLFYSKPTFLQGKLTWRKSMDYWLWSELSCGIQDGNLMGAGWISYEEDVEEATQTHKLIFSNTESLCFLLWDSIESWGWLNKVKSNSRDAFYLVVKCLCTFFLSHAGWLSLTKTRLRMSAWKWD